MLKKSRLGIVAMFGGILLSAGNQGTPALTVKPSAPLVQNLIAATCPQNRHCDVQ